MRWIVFLVAVVVVVLGAEWGLRVFFPVGVALLEGDEERLVRAVPGVVAMRRVETGGGRWVRVEVNEDGYRGGELRAAGEARRVAVYGDSLVMASDFPVEETFVRRLEVALAGRTGEAWEVVNAGVTGYGPDQAVLRMEREIERLRPESVVLVLCAHNDLGDLVRNRLFGLGPDGSLERRSPRLADDVSERLARGVAESRRPAIVRLVARALGTPEEGDEIEDEVAFVQWYLEAAAAEHAAWAAGDDVVASVLRDHYDADVALAPGMPAVLDKVRLLGGVLARAREVTASRGIRLLAVVVPSAVDLDPGFAIRVEPARWPTYFPAQLTDTYVKALADLGIEGIDLFPEFQASGPGELFVGGYDFHWNARGQALAAERVAERLAR